MALIVCNECGKEISDTAKRCPNCGTTSNRKHKFISFKSIVNFVKKRKMVTILSGIIIILVIVIAVVLFNNSKSNEVEVTKIDLQKIYNDVNCNDTYCDIAGDGSYLEIDTNPYNIDDFYSAVALDYIKEVNLKLEFTESLYTRMGKTRALDGTLTEKSDLIQVSWTYHPDNGLEVIYSIINPENIKQSKSKTY